MPDRSLPEPSVEVSLAPERALAEVARAAEDWGGEWTREINGGRLRLPVVAGLRRGVVSGHVAVSPAGRGSRISFTRETTEFRLQWTGVAILAVGALGGLVVTLWPFFPALLPLAPAALVLAFAAWLMVASRLRISGIEEFLSSLEEPRTEKPQPDATAPR